MIKGTFYVNALKLFTNQSLNYFLLTVECGLSKVISFQSFYKFICVNFLL